MQRSAVDGDALIRVIALVSPHAADASLDAFAAIVTVAEDPQIQEKPQSMCWNRNVSIVAAVWGWVACALLAYRGGRNDRWYALYLFTFTLTQVIDAVLWSLQYDRGLEACDGRRMSFAVGAPDGQLANLIVSKYAIPAVVIIQYAAQLAYPSSRNPRLRKVMLLGYVAAGVVMCYTSGARPVPIQHPFTPSS